MELAAIGRALVLVLLVHVELQHVADLGPALTASHWFSFGVRVLG